MAVRSAYNIQKQARCDSWAEQRKAERAAVESFLKKHPSAAGIIAKANATIVACNLKIEAASDIIRSFGLYRESSGANYSINDHEKFAKAGGKYAYTAPQKWTFDQVMAQLAAADEKDAKTILKKFGINWT